MEEAPASRPAIPASRTNRGSAVAPAIPITRPKFESSPSLAPKTAGRPRKACGAILQDRESIQAAPGRAAALRAAHAYDYVPQRECHGPRPGLCRRPGLEIPAL